MKHHLKKIFQISMQTCKMSKVFCFFSRLVFIFIMEWRIRVATKLFLVGVIIFVRFGLYIKKITKPKLKKKNETEPKSY